RRWHPRVRGDTGHRPLVREVLLRGRHAASGRRRVCQHARNPPSRLTCSQPTDSSRASLSNLFGMDRGTMEGIQIYELKRMDLRGATVIDGFPSVGLVSSIVANYLINALNLTQIGIMDSIYFPTVALVRDGQPTNQVRIYAGPGFTEGVFPGLAGVLLNE